MDNIKVYFSELNSDWDNKISKFSFDIYHLSDWINSSTLIDLGDPKGIIAEYNDKQIFLPFIMRRLEDAYWDATCAYGYGGPIIDELLSPAEANTLLKAMTNYLYDSGCVSLFTRLNPIIHKHWHSDVGTLITHGRTLASDLSKSETDHWQETQHQHRRGIKKSLEKQITTKIETLNEKTIADFIKIYYETMQKNSASHYYYFEEAYFQHLAKKMSDRLLVISAFDKEEVIASSIYTLCPETGIMQFHLGGTLDRYRKLQPSKLITHEARNWGRENKFKVLHFGGGVGGQLDSLYHYKKGFSSNELDFKTWRVIINLEKYDQLVTENADILANDLPSDYFPLYRYQSRNQNSNQSRDNRRFYRQSDIKTTQQDGDEFFVASVSVANSKQEKFIPVALGKKHICFI